MKNILTCPKETVLKLIGPVKKLKSPPERSPWTELYLDVVDSCSIRVQTLTLIEDIIY